MNYRKPKQDGEFSPWLRALRGASGVYFIRQERGFWDEGGLVYIGESHTGRLYETITRHFQSWDGRRARYDASRCWVGVRRVRKAEDAIDLQYAAIQKHKPRDNQIKGTTLELEEAPF